MLDMGFVRDIALKTVPTKDKTNVLSKFSKILKN
jgi:hypothetical protein